MYYSIGPNPWYMGKQNELGPTEKYKPLSRNLNKTKEKRNERKRRREKRGEMRRGEGEERKF